MSAHTPGPWKFVQGCHVYANDRIVSDGYDNPNSFYDCRLIAAAPDLLETLLITRAWVSMYHNESGHDSASRCMTAVIDKAISKATGKETP
jgi:hypothetical protein